MRLMYRDKETGEVVKARRVGHYDVVVYWSGVWLPGSWMLDDFRARFEPVQPQPGSE